MYGVPMLQSAMSIIIVLIQAPHRRRRVGRRKPIKLMCFNDERQQD